ncbi:leucine rich repeat (LRR) protein [Anaeroplasma bactoclasticum]|uniref:Leucine rich repeat (LRR) protein n=1 Tax=Anaeroplasma bactoclasticum TaxID=2088 RepID=A0A397RZJ7_9MOLU|nr:leucine-rich repeat domain-containing protein [Anaeroplasma bactoclasticum]RIA77986.1 leucine rich repeat (LRR) protein [Anaeroplasma bactoclasticum]
MNKKLKYLIIIASAIALIATILTIVFVQNLKDSEGIREYEMDGYKYKIELMNDSENEACFFIPQNGKEIHIPEEITIKERWVEKKYTVTEIKFDYVKEKLTPDSLIYKTKIIVPKTVSRIRDDGFDEFTYAMINKEKMGFYVPNVGDIEVAIDNPYFDSRENSNCIIETKTDKILIAGLNSPKIPSTVKEIGSFAFYIYNQTELTIPSNVKKIDSCAFMGCESLNSIKFEEGVEEIAIYAFVLLDVFIEKDDRSYYNLNEIYIPSTMKKISEVPFAFCNSYETKLYYNGSDFSSIVSKDLFYTHRQSIGNVVITHISPYTKDGYFYIEGWCHPIGYIYLYSETAPSNEGNYWHYVDGNITIWE